MPFTGAAVCSRAVVLTTSPEAYEGRNEFDQAPQGRLERETRLELATPTLARLCSTTELLPRAFDLA